MEPVSHYFQTEVLTLTVFTLLAVLYIISMITGGKTSEVAIGFAFSFLFRASYMPFLHFFKSGSCKLSLCLYAPSLEYIC